MEPAYSCISVASAAEGGEGEGCPACHEADAADGGDCAEDADAGEREDVEAAAEEHCAKCEERGGDGEGASLPAHGEQAGGKQGEGVVHLEAGGGLEGAECACVQGVAQSVCACCARDDGEEAKDCGDGDCGCRSCHGVDAANFSTLI